MAAYVAWHTCSPCTLREWVPAGKDWLLTGEDWMPTDMDWLLTGKDWVPTGEDWVPTGKDWLLTGEDWLLTGEDWLPTGKDWLLTGKDLLSMAFLTSPYIPLLEERNFDDDNFLGSAGSCATQIGFAMKTLLRQKLIFTKQV